MDGPISASRQLIPFFAALAIAIVAGRPGAGQIPVLQPLASETKLLPTVTEQIGHDFMGFGTEIDGDTLVTIADSDFSAMFSGAVFVFQLDGGTWTHRATLTREVDGDYRWFSDTAISGSVVAVGATHDLNAAGVETGLVHLFQDTSTAGDWSSYSTISIEPGDGQEYDMFGQCVGLWGRTLVVWGRGKLYVFTDTSAGGDWSSYSEVEITPSAGTSVGYFDVQSQGETAFADTIATNWPSGHSVVVFRDTSAARDWSSHAEVVLPIPPPPPDGGYFSDLGISIDGRTIATGQLERYRTELSGGSVFAFKDTSPSGDWSSHTVAEVFSSGATPYKELGWGVDVEGSTIIAGAPTVYDPWNGSLAGPGAAFIFEDTSPGGDLSSYSETELVPPAVAINDHFGISVALEGPVAAVGANYGEVAADRDGFVDIFDGDAGWNAVQRLSQVGIGDQERQNFGERVVTDGSTVIVSAPGDDLDMADSGTLYVYQQQDGTWIVRRQIQAAETLFYDRFGQGMGLEPGRILASGNGSLLDDPGAEEIPAHLTVLTDTSASGDWQSYTEVTVPFDATTFEAPLAADGRNAAVGDPEFDGTYDNQGIVRVFHDDSPDGNWSSVTTRAIHEASPVSGSEFGASVALRGRVMLIGAPHRNNYNIEAGRAFLFFDTSASADWSSFTETAVNFTDAMPYDHFGSAVTLENGWAAIGEPGDDNVLLNGGAVHILVDTSGDGSWSTYDMLKLVPPDPDLITEHAGFGSALAAWGRILVVGAPSTDAPDEAGSVWVFADTSPDADWSSTAWARLVPSDSAPGDNFGASVAVAASTVVVGAPLHTEGDLTTGAAYIFESALPGVDLGVELSDAPDPVDAGDPLVFETVVTNHGTAAASGLELDVTFTPDVSITSASGPGWTCTTAAGEVSCTLDSLDAGLDAAVTIDTVAPTDRGAVTATAVITSVEVDANDSDNTAASKTKVLGEMLFEDSFESGDLGAWDEIPP